MKKLLLFFVFVSSFAFSQQLVLNEITKVYEFTNIAEYNESFENISKRIIKNLKDLNYTNIIVDNDRISAESFYSKLVITTPVKINYQVVFEFKENRYKLLINKFVLDDNIRALIPLENLKSYTKKWVKDINKNLPTIVKALEYSPEKW